MKSNKLSFATQKITNRFIALKFAEIPIDDEFNFIIKPQRDGIGFILNLTEMKKFDISPNDILGMNKIITEMNSVFSKSYLKLKKEEMGLNKIKQKDDIVLLLLLILCIAATVAIEISLVSNNYSFLILFGLGIFIFVFLVVLYYAFVAITMNIDKQEDLLELVKPEMIVFMKNLNTFLEPKGLQAFAPRHYYYIRITRII